MAKRKTKRQQGYRASRKAFAAEARVMLALSSSATCYVQRFVHLLAAAVLRKYASGEWEASPAAHSMATGKTKVGAYWGKPFAHPLAEAIVSVVTFQGEYFGDDKQAAAFAAEFANLLSKHYPLWDRGLLGQGFDLHLALAEQCECDGVIGYHAALAARLASCLSNIDYGK